MNSVTNWFSEYGGMVNILVQGFIAYHVFHLTQKLSNKTKLEHKDLIKRKADELLSKIQIEKLSRKVYLVNINRYYKDYPSNSEKILEGYSHIRADIKSTRFDGIEFFEEMPKLAYKKKDGSLSFNGNKKDKSFNVYSVGIVPYEWIELIDLEGDEYGFVPLFYCHYKGKTNWKFWKRLLFFGYPYKKMIYYKKSDVYEENNDTPDMKYEYISQHIQ